MNITELAKLAGVSKAAVSRYFNHGYLSPEKRARIEAAVQATGYSPNERARTLRTRKTQQIGLILPRLSSESCARVAEGVSRVLGEEGYQLLLVNTQNTPEKEVEALDLLRHNRVDGVIFLASIFTPAHEAVLQSMQVPVVIVGQRHAGQSCVYHNDRGAAFALTRLMLQKGCHRPAYLGVTARDEAAGLARREGYAAAVKAAGLPLRAEHMSISGFEMDSGYAQAQKLLAAAPRPDCLFCATDHIALGVMQYCREQGISIPGELLVAAVGDTRVGSMAAVPLTTAHLHYHTSGRQAAQLLLEQLRQRDAVRRSIQLEYELVERDSTGRAPVG